jgi:hypothetical protein
MIMFAVLLVIVSACGGTSQPLPTNTAPALPSTEPVLAPTMPLGTVDASCRKQELEGWIQASGQHTRALVDVINTQALITPPDQMGPLLGQVNAIYDLVKAAPRPTCAQSSVDMVTALFDSVITQLTSYEAGQQIDMAKLVGDTLVAYEQFRLKDEEMRQLYRTLPRG